MGPQIVKRDVLDRSVPQLFKVLSDLFYGSRKTILDVYNEVSSDEGLVDLEAFIFLVKKYAPSFKESETQSVFKNVVSKRGSKMSFNQFKKAFSWKVPVGNFEVEGLQRIRTWMTLAGLSSEQAFEQLTESTGSVNKQDFCDRITQKRGIEFTAPELDLIFKYFDSNRDGRIDFKEWTAKIYEDSTNPLALIREVITTHRLTSDELLHKMKLRIWDDSLSLSQFNKCMRELDPTLTDAQLKGMGAQMKDKTNKVPIFTLLHNLVGGEFETYDFRNRIYKRIYSEVREQRKEEALRKAFSKHDKQNDGTLGVMELKRAFMEVIQSVDEISVEKFIKFLEKDKKGRISYTELLDKMNDLSNKEHNPFQQVIRRIKYFMNQNRMDNSALLKRLSTQEQREGAYHTGSVVSVDYFGRFLKSKIDKKREESELMRFATMMDIDQDTFIDINDLNTCLGNLQNDAFFSNNGEQLAQSAGVSKFSAAFTTDAAWFPKEKMAHEKTAEVVKKIKEALVTKNLSFQSFFSKLDGNNNGLLSFAEFTNGIDKVIKLSPIVKEQLFALMDVNSIGMVDYDSFLEVLHTTIVSRPKTHVPDNFNWEESIIQQLKDYIAENRITVEEAFKTFDKDFDGQINKQDLKWVIQHILKQEDEIQPTKLERLFQLLDFYKSGSIQLSDIARLSQDENPYRTSGAFHSTKFSNATSTFQWRNNAIQQIGLGLSKNYSSLTASFEEVSEGMGKIDFTAFKAFLDKSRFLNGFNLTTKLQQQLFSELDAHKKGFITENDWNLAFSQFDWNNQLILELQNALSISFSDASSAFEFFIQFQRGQKKNSISRDDFIKGFRSLTNNRFSAREISSIWEQVAVGASLNKQEFNSHFDQMEFRGTSTLVRNKQTMGKTMMLSQNSSNTKWSNDIMEKLRTIIKASPYNIKQLFKQMDTDKSGKLTAQEFRNGVRKLGVGLTSREIDQILIRVDTNQDGLIDYKEFVSKFSDSESKDVEKLINTRAQGKLAEIKDYLTLHMGSPTDAFNNFDSARTGSLSYDDFNKLIEKIYELHGEAGPNYQVMKDLFDIIDVRKDGVIDQHEWKKVFERVATGGQRTTIRTLPPQLAEWENSRGFDNISQAIGKNRKLLLEQFNANQVEGFVDFETAKNIVRMIQRGTQLEDEQYQLVFKGAMVKDQINYKKFLDIHKKRFTNRGMFPN